MTKPNLQAFMEDLMEQLGDMDLDPAINWDFVAGQLQIFCTLPPAVLTSHLREEANQLEES